MIFFFSFSFPLYFPTYKYFKTPPSFIRHTFLLRYIKFGSGGLDIILSVLLICIWIAGDAFVLSFSSTMRILYRIHTASFIFLHSWKNVVNLYSNRTTEVKIPFSRYPLVHEKDSATNLHAWEHTVWIDSNREKRNEYISASEHNKIPRDVSVFK